MKENIVKIARIIIYVLLILVFLVNSVIFGFYCSIITFTSIITSNFDIQIFLYLIVLLLLTLGFISSFFMKSTNKFRILLLLVLIILQMVYFRISFYIPTVNKVIEIEACLDSGKLWNDVNNTCEIKNTN
mgnify:CR=1 FL=1